MATMTILLIVILAFISSAVITSLWMKFRLSRRHSAAFYDEVTDTVTAIKHALLQSNLSAIVAIDQNDLIIEFNPSAERLFKRNRRDVLGKVMGELIIPERFRKMHYAGMNHYINTGEGPVIKKRIEVSALNSDGDEFPIEMEITPIESGRTSIFVAVINDITERKNSRKKIVDALNQAEDANRAKSSFLTSVSHEIRTPLHAILSLIECLQHTALNDQQFKYVSTAQQAGESLLNMVNDILDLGQIEAGKREVHLSTCHPNTILAEHLEVYRHSINEKGLELYLIESADVPRTIETDVTMLRQILSNLLSNACKYTEVGAVSVHSRCQTEMIDDRQKIWWCCDVRDTGVGLTEDQIKALFQEFTRFHPDGSSSGTGVGLMISRLLAQQLGGELSVTSHADSGTCFTLSLPINTTRPKRIYAKLVKTAVYLCSDNQRWLTCFMQQLTHISLVDIHVIKPGQLCTLPPNAIVIFDSQNYAESMFGDICAVAQQRSLKLITAGDDLVANLENCNRHFAFISQPYHRKDIMSALRAALNGRKLAFNSERALSSPVLVAPSNANKAFNILLVDDSEVNRLTIRTFLGLEGMKVKEAANGEEAVLAVKQERFDLILMDMRMPVLDGIEATEQIRQQKLADDTPIIALTAHVQENEKQRCLAAGMQDFLTKPIGKAVLIKRVTHWLTNQSAGTSLAEHEVNVSGLILDETLLLNLKRDLPADKFQRLLDMFLAEIQRQVTEVENFLVEKNYNRVEILVHAIKSSAHTFGAMQLSDITKQMELACQAQQFEKVDLYFKELRKLCQLTLDAFISRGYVNAR